MNEVLKTNNYTVKQIKRKISTAGENQRIRQIMTPWSKG